MSDYLVGPQKELWHMVTFLRIVVDELDRATSFDGLPLGEDTVVSVYLPLRTQP